MRILVAMIVLLGVLVISGCQPVLDNAGEYIDLEETPAYLKITGSPGGTLTPPGKIDLPMSETPERLPPSEPTAPLSGEVPQGLLDAIFKDVAALTGAAQEEISVIQAQAVVWGDGSLGCPQPGMEYAQSLVNGYWVVLEVEGKPYDYRATSKANFFLCQRGTPPVSPGIAPNT
jgi:hypothetical protein